MKRSDFLNKVETRLRDRRQALVSSVNAELSEIRNEDEHTSWENEADDIDDICDDLNSRLAERASDELQQIDAALARLKAGTYGECEDCGCSIPTIRLQALPFTTLCIGCQSDREQTPRDPDEYFVHRWTPSSNDYSTEDLDSYEQDVIRNPILECRALQVI